MIAPGVVGSPIDAATLIVSLVVLYRLRESQGDGHAVTTAIARVVERVDDDRVAADLEVTDDHEVEQYLVADGGGEEADG